MLEDAYLRSRYAVESYVKEDAKRCIKVAEDVVAFVHSMVGERPGSKGLAEPSRKNQRSRKNHPR